MSAFRFTKQNKLKVLRRMRELLGRRGGWIKGMADNGRGGFCLLGAESVALAELTGEREQVAWRYDKAGRKLSLDRAARDRGYDLDVGNAYPVALFNDAKKTRKKDVLALIDEKIAELER